MKFVILAPCPTPCPPKGGTLDGILLLIRNISMFEIWIIPLSLFTIYFTLQD
jgi:hypothetical protein